MVNTESMLPQNHPLRRDQETFSRPVRLSRIQRIPGTHNSRECRVSVTLSCAFSLA